MTKLILILITGILLGLKMNCYSQNVSKQEVHIIPSNHLDRAWLKPFEVNRLRMVNMMDNLIEVMEQNREFKYFTLG